ncbi:non-ribosomal peptide synthase/polyketide synthase [Pseudomonas qingdaonensis]|nr:non-ribosomal peptide synthase/polyketide synthase [Pseudomonas qingdaonensis]
MNAQDSLKLARRFIELPTEKRPLFLEALRKEGVDFSQFPIPANATSSERDGLSYAQGRMWFLWQLDPQGAAYNLPMAVRLKGELDNHALQQAFDALVARHETLRTLFEQGDGQVRQRVLPPTPVTIVTHDLSHLAPADRETQVGARVESDAGSPFDLGNGPLLRVQLLRLDACEHVLLLTLHHIVADGWSLNVLIDEFIRLYDAASSSGEAALPELPIQYRDYALWQRSWLEAGEQERQLGYWREKLGDDHAPLVLPFDHLRPAIPTQRGARHAFEVQPALAEQLRSLARAQGATLFMVLLGGFKLLLQRYSGQRAIRVGVPVANRNRAEVEGLIGCFINTQVLHTDIDPLIDVAELVQRIKHTAVGAQAHQDLPFERLVEALDLPRSANQGALFQVLFNHQANIADAAQITTRSGLALEKVALDKHSARFDLALDTYESAGRLHATFTYALDLFDAATIVAMGEHWVQLLQGLVADASCAVGELPLLVAGTPHIDTPALALDDTCIHHLIEQAGAATAQGIAAISAGRQITYATLCQRSDALAAALRQAGVQVDERVGVVADRSIDMLVAILAVLKAGAAYLPLEPEQPRERLDFMLADSNVRVVLAASTWAETLPVQVHLMHADAVYPDAAAPVVAVAPDNLAYVIYTSGTTGRPKGVGISHGALANYVRGVGRRLPMQAIRSLAMVTTPAADLGHTVLFGALCSGKTLHLLDKQTVLDADAFARYLHEHAVDALKIVPSHLEAMLPAGSAALPRQCLILGGEACTPALLQRIAGLAPTLAVINHYGPTETTVGVLTHAMDGQPVLGTPLDNLRVKVLDACLQPVPGAARGELYIAGAGLARGYLGRAGLTAERFVPDPDDAAGGRLYRTGDWVRRNGLGQLLFAGRMDGQVKIRGYRVELAEIESRVRELPGIRAAVVRVVGEGQAQQLAAYLVPVDAPHGDAAQQALLDASRTALKQALPEHMVPTHLSLLERLPVTANGKLDLKALPQPAAAQTTYRAPQTPLQAVVAQIWAEVLHMDQVGLDDNFFALGGHSLLATQVVSRVRKQLGLDIPLRALFDSADLLAFTDVAQALAPVTQADFEVLDRSAPLAVSHAQYRQWLFWKLHPHSAAYNTPLAVRLHGALDLSALQSAFDSLVGRHESLRSVFDERDGMPWQRVLPPAPLAIAIHDLSAEPVQALMQRLDEEAATPFDLAHGPLLRVSLFKCAGDEHVLGLMLHHIVSDGWSMGVMMRELANAYNARVRGEPLHLEALPVQYADYAAWQRKRLAQGLQQAQLEYWKDQLEDDFAVLELPADRSRPKEQSHQGGRIDIRLPDTLASGLRELAVQHNATLFHVLLAAFAIVLSRYSGKPKVNIGIPVTNRNRLELEGLIGFFVNTLVARVGIDPALTFSQLLEAVKDTALQAQANKDVPFDALVDELKPERGLGYNPLFQVMYNHLRDVGGQVSADSLHGLHVEEIDLVEQTAHFDISLNTFERASGLVATFNYCTDLFDAARIQRMAAHWQNLLEGICQAPRQRLAQLSLLGADERRQILGQWQPGQQSSQRQVHQLIADHATLTPNAVAVLCEGRQLTYAQLNAQSNRLAHHLIELGVGPEVRVAVALRRSVDTVVALLAVLKAGGAYVPLDVAYPQDRLHYMIEDCKAALVLTQHDVLDQLALPGAMATLLVDQPQAWQERADTTPQVALNEGNLAYVIYTSGSTGQPKGVAVAHGPLVAHVLAIGERYEMTPRDCELQFMSLAFDGAHERWLTALSHGARLLLRGDELWSPEQACQVMREQGVTVTALPPVYLQQVAEHVEQAGNPPAVRIYCFGGDAVPQASYALAWRVLRPQYIVNGYGPTETVVTPLLWKAREGDTCGAAYAPIGSLVGRRTAYVLDAELNLLPNGLAGELYLGGQGVARGYLDRPGLTAERFVPDPFAADGTRVYRSGDLTRVRADGLVDYLGRIDYQVKIRGFRIELGEIEARLQGHPQVREAVVVDIPGPSGKQLAGYLVPVAALDVQQHTALRNTLREHLKAVLPDYMVPAHLIVLDALPLTPNGKLDRKALPKPDASLLQQAYVAPQSDLEHQLAALWAGVLKVEQVGVTDNFFELGGDSIISIQLVSRARQAGIHFSPKELFQHQTVQGLASVARQGEQARQIDQGAASGQALLLPVHQYFFGAQMPEQHHWNQAVLLKPGQTLQAQTLEQALQALTTQHDALRLNYSLQADGQWAAHYGAVAQQQTIVWAAAAEHAEALQALCEKAQRSLNLERGELLRAVLATLPDGSQRLLLAIHHLVVDGVSWRILLEDLQTAYTQLAAGQAVTLPAKTSSTQAWAQRLQTHAATLQPQLAYWTAELAGVSAELPCDHPQGSLQGVHLATAHTVLDAATTRKLLQQAPAAYRTQVNDLLLTALARVIARWTERDEVLIQLEGHGREDLFDDVDLTRTVGWFTSMFPVKLSPTDSLDGSIKRIKEQLRAVPDKGIGFGALRYLGDAQAREALAALPVPRITFNYLGQFDGSFAEDGQDAFLTPASEHAGANQSPEAPLGNWLAINGQVYGGELKLGWSFSRRMFDEPTIQALAQAYAEELKALIAHCVRPDSFGLTPSDFPIAGLTQARLDELPVAARDIEDIYPLSPMQQGMLLHTLMDPHSGIYFMQARKSIRSPIDFERFTAAWRAVAQRHEPLRTSFSLDRDGQMLQIVHRQAQLSVSFLDWSEQTPEQQEVSLQALLRDERDQGFRLLEQPPIWVRLIRRETDHYWFILSNHHILLDAWCHSQLFEDFFTFYNGQTLPAAERFGSFIGWLQQQDEQAALAMWREELQDFSEVTALPFDRKKGDGESAGIGDNYVYLAPEQGRLLHELAQRNQITVNTFAQAAWSLVLHRYSGLHDVLFGVTVAGRPVNRPEMQSTVGLFINSIALRVDIPQAGDDLSVKAWLQRLFEKNFTLREYEYLPLVQIQACSAVEAGHPIFDSLLVYENAPMESKVLSNAQQLNVAGSTSRTHTNYPLTVVIYPGDELGLHLSYDQSYFDEPTIAALLEDFRRLLLALAEGFHGRFDELALVGAPELAKVHEQPEALAEYPLEAGYVNLFEAQLAAHPEQVVARCEAQAWTYRELDAHASRVAQALMAAGAKPDQPVAMLSERNLELLGMAVGVFKAGCAYLALDPQLPDQRLAEVLALAGAPVLLASSDFAARARTLLALLPEARRATLLIDDALPPVDVPIDYPGRHTGGRALAYLIYTSGSTGTPKGVQVEQRGMLNNQLSKVPYLQLDDADVIAQTASQSFDISVWQLLAAPLFGAQVDIVPNRIAHDPRALLSYVRERGITLLESVPSLLQVMLDELEQLGSPGQELGRLRWLLTTGEALAPELARRWVQRYPEVGLVNAYGPAECSDDVALFNVLPASTTGIRLPIGVATDNNRLYLLNGNLDPVPNGAISELFVAGIGVGRGYLGDARRTAATFLPDPFDTSVQGGGRLYRSGDLARHGADGVLEYVGRTDHQVKIRGFRIELGEIEIALQAHAAVREAVVLAVQGLGGKQLAAYVVASGAGQAELRGALRDHLKAMLPEYMVPSYFVFLDTLPLNPNGKLDRKALPAPDTSQVQQQFVAPVSVLEQQVAAIWAQVLKVEQVGLNDNFFELGGHSLLATQVVSRLRQQLEVELPLRALFEAPLLADFIADVQGASRATAPAFRHVARNQPLRLSYAQQRQLFLWQLDAHSTAYNMPLALSLKGALDIDALQASFTSLIERHETLRTTFSQADGQAVQVIHAPAPFTLQVEQVGVPAGADAQAWVKTLVEAETRRVFDLQQGPLLRVKLLALAEGEHVLVLTLHHIVSDGWSMPVMVEELVQFYEGHRRGQPLQLPALAIQYADYAVWQRQWMEAGEQARQLAYWTTQLAGGQALLELPTDRPRPATQSHAGANLGIELDPSLASALEQLAKAQGVTLFMLLLASFQALLHRYTGQDDIRVGVPIANRTRLETERLIGFFVNTQVLKAEFDSHTTFAQLLQQVQRTALAAQGHQDLPFEQLVEALHPQRSLSHTPLFQVMYSHQSQVKGARHSLPGLTVESLAWEQGTAQFDLTLETVEQANGLGATLNYATALFDEASIQRLASHWRQLLQGIVEQPQQRIAELALLDGQEQARIVQAWNPVEAEHAPGPCIHQRIAAQANRTPQAIAVAFGDQSLSYAALDQRANQLAHKLREQGVGPDVLVGLAVERSLEMVVGVLGILKAGGAYVPLDPEYPQDRLAYMIEDSGIKLLLTQAHLELPLSEAVERVVFEADAAWLEGYSTAAPVNLATPDNLAYVIYTSGSTGKPKGTLLPHHNVMRLFAATQHWFDFDASDVWSVFHSYAFDFSVWELFGALLHGAKAVVVPREVARSPEDFHALLVREQVTVLNQTPSAFKQLIPVACANPSALALRYVVFGGEALDVASLKPWFERFGDQQPQLINMYGITETTVHVTYRPLSLADLQQDGVSPIGEVIPDLSWYLLDSDFNLAPPGCHGELHVGRAGLARGYHRRASLTALRFVPDPFDRSVQGGGRLYRTGDLARYRGDGVIEYVGRIDHQVKIRGFRIELGEIEARLQEHPAIREAVVLDIDGATGKQLVAYLLAAGPVEAAQQSALRTGLREHLKGVLPDYMVPAHLMFLEAWPLTGNGKLDRRALPRPDTSQLQQAYVAPHSEREQQVAAIWAQVLQVEQVGLTDNFFELGGHSLLATQVMVRLREVLGIETALKDLFEYPELGEFVRSLEEKNLGIDPLQAQLAKSLEALKRLTTEELDELIS